MRQWEKRGRDRVRRGGERRDRGREGDSERREKRWRVIKETRESEVRYRG